MTKEQIVVSLDLAKRLKEWGAKQESLFYWVISLTTNYHVSYTEGDKSLLPQDRNDFYSAFTVSELGEMLPRNISKNDKLFWIYTTPFEPKQWTCAYMNHENIPTVLIDFQSPTEADARAKMLIYLIENKLIMI